MKLADPGVTKEARGLTEATSGSADLFTAVAVSRRSAALDVCVASSGAVAARGDAAQAAFDPETSHDRREIQDLRVQGIVYRPVVSTADRRPHPAVTRTMQCAADRSMPQWTTHASESLSKTGGNMRSKLPCIDEEQLRREQSCQTHERENIGSWLGSLTAPQTTGLGLLPWMEAHMMTLTPGRTRQCQMMMTTSLPSPVNKPPPLMSKTCDFCTHASSRGGSLVNGPPRT